MVPVIDSTKTMGIVFLPGAMTGMILAGADPLQAVRLQIAVVFMLHRRRLADGDAGKLSRARPETWRREVPRAEGGEFSLLRGAD